MKGKSDILFKNERIIINFLKNEKYFEIFLKNERKSLKLNIK